MEILSALIIFVVTFLFVKLFIKNYICKKDLPPCLPHVPILGSMPFLVKYQLLYKFLTEKSKQLGNVMGLYLANRYAVILSGREAIDEALIDNSVAFAQRPFYFFHNFSNTQKLGIAEHPYDDHFKKFHSLSLSILKRFGFGQRIMERRIQREVEEMIRRFDEKKGNAFDPAKIVILCVSNVIVSIIFGKRMQLENPKFEELMEIVRVRFKNIKDHRTLDFFPFLRFLQKYKNLIKLSQENEQKMRKCIQEQIEESLEGKTNQSFINYFIQEIGEDTEKEQLLYTLRDFFLAGTDTVTSTLLWFIILLANHPLIQEKCQKEIDSVVGRDSLPTLDHKGELKYLEAVIMESMRLKTIVPFSLLHVTSADTTVQGKNIPAGTWVFPNIYSVHMDEKTWKDPLIFNPERFIDINGNIINKNQIIPFSLGKRKCLGEILARQELFLFTSALLHQYQILPPEGIHKIGMEEDVGVTISPKNFNVRIIRR